MRRVEIPKFVPPVIPTELPPLQSFVTFQTPEEKRLWLRKHAPYNLRILCDHVLAPYRHYGLLPPFHRDRCRELDTDLRLGRNAVNIWTRGLWKSQTISVAHTIQRILQNPNITILLRHFDEEIAAELVADVTDHFCANPHMRYVFPEFCPPLGDEKKWSSIKTFTTPARQFRRTEATLLGEGLNSTVTGRHFDHIHDDDVETPKSVGREVSEDVRAKHWSRWLDWAQLAERPREDGPHRGTYSMVGTPWHCDGIVARAKERASQFKFTFRWHPAYDYKSDQLLCPEAYPRKTLDRDRAALDSYEFACAILLDPVDEGRASFHVTDDIYWFIPPGDYTPWRRVISVDPAYTNSSKNDYTGIVVVDIMPDDVWVVIACYALRLEPYSLIQELFDLNRKFRPETIFIESIAQGQMLCKWLHREEERVGERLPIYEAKYHRFKTGKKERKGEQKSARIKKLSPRVQAGKMRLWKLAPNLNDLTEEMRQWPLGKDEHLLDALTTLEEYAPRGPVAEGPPRPDPVKDFLEDLKNERPATGAPEGSINWWEEGMELADEEADQEIGAWRKPGMIERWAAERRPFR